MIICCAMQDTVRVSKKKIVLNIKLALRVKKVLCEGKRGFLKPLFSVVIGATEHILT